MVAYDLAKIEARVRFPLAAPVISVYLSGTIGTDVNERNDMPLFAFLIILFLLFAFFGFFTLKWLLILALIALVCACFSGYHTWGGPRRW